MRPSVRPFTLSNINISETSWPIIIKFHQKHHWGGGLTALGFRLDWIRTLVSMAIDSSHWVIMGKILTTLAPSFLIRSSLFLQVTRTTIKSRMGSKFGRIRPGTYELAALERLEKSPYTYNGKNVVTTLVPSFLDESASFLQITRPTIKAWMGLNFCKISSLTSELAALERQKNRHRLIMGEML